MNTTARLNQLSQQFLVHSFIYYRLGEAIISDEQFDKLTQELSHLAQHSTADFAYAEVVRPLLGDELSGYAIKQYPEPIITTALKLLYAHLKPNINWEEFIERRGFKQLS